MKTHIIGLAVLSCVLLVVVPAVAGPIQFSTPSPGSSADGKIGQVGPDFLSSLHSSAPSGFGAYPSDGSPNPDKIVVGPLPPIGPPAPAPEPSAMMVLLSSGTLAALGLWGRRLKGLI